MKPDDSFAAYYREIYLITQLMASTRGAAGFADREARLKAACEHAILSLDEDLQAILRLEEELSGVGCSLIKENANASGSGSLDGGDLRQSAKVALQPQTIHREHPRRRTPDDRGMSARSRGANPGAPLSRARND